ncbi:MAG: alpha/beta fold hydrolase [Nannocystales bacterium]
MMNKIQLRTFAPLGRLLQFSFTATLAFATVGCDKIEETQIEVGDFVFDAYVAGPEDGEFVLLLHGFPESAVEWEDQLRELGDRGYRAVAFNQRGYSPGARPEEVEAYTTVNLAGDAIAVADAMGAESFHVVGHDWGAAVAWRVAGLAPERVESLTVISVSHTDAYVAAFSDPESCQSQVGTYIFPFLSPGYEEVMLADDAAILRDAYAELDPAQVEAHLAVVGNPEALGAALKWYRAAFTLPEPSPPLGTISTPTTLVWGDEDEFTCVDSIVDTENHMSGPYQLEVMAGQGHWLPEVNPDEVTDFILERIED